LNRACISLGNLCNLVIYCSDRRNAREGCRAVCNAVFEPTLNALISLDNVVLQAIAVICNHPFASTKGALTLTAHCRY
jgi:hypothetical protein